MHQQLVARLAPGQARAVVHPGVVVGLVPATDQQQLVGVRQRDGGAQPGQVGDDPVRREVDQLVPRLQPSRHRRPERSEVDAGGVGPERPHRRTAAGQEQRGDDGPRAHAEPRPLAERLAQGLLLLQACGGAQGDLAEDLPVLHRALRLLEDSGREPGGVAHGQGVEDQVVLVALQRRRRRQHHVGVPGGLVEVDVDRGHEVEPVEGFAEPLAVGGGQHGVAGDRQHGADLPVARRLDLLAQRADRAARRRTRDAAAPGCARRRGGPARRSPCRRCRRPAR